jgi:hypothetical protein
VPCVWPHQISLGGMMAEQDGTLALLSCGMACLGSEYGHRICRIVRVIWLRPGIWTSPSLSITPWHDPTFVPKLSVLDRYSFGVLGMFSFYFSVCYLQVRASD